MLLTERKILQIEGLDHMTSQNIYILNHCFHESFSHLHNNLVFLVALICLKYLLSPFHLAFLSPCAQCAYSSLNREINQHMKNIQKRLNRFKLQIKSIEVNSIEMI